MSRWRLAVLYGFLLCFAAYAALQSRRSPSPSTLPSIDNFQPKGLRALWLYLSQRGYDVNVAPAFSELVTQPPDTLVLAAPEVRAISAEERKSLESFVRAGHRLVYLTPSTGPLGQPELADWLELDVGKWKRPERLATGRELPVRETGWPLRGVERLQVGAGRSITTAREHAVPLVGTDEDWFAWRIPEGSGEVYVFAGTDIAQNQWIDRGGNLELWEQLARRGPIRFDEQHHRLLPRPPPSRAIWAVGLQLVLVVGVLFWSRGRRLGPPRPTVQERHRSGREYLESFAWLLRRARVEPQLLEALRLRHRRRLWEDAGIPTSAPDDEAALRWAEHTGLSGERYRRWADETRRARTLSAVAPADYARLCSEAARLELALTQARDPGR